MLEAATELLRNLLARKPVVLVIDDAHWAREPALLLLRHLLRTSVHLDRRARAERFLAGRTDRRDRVTVSSPSVP